MEFARIESEFARRPALVQAQNDAYFAINLQDVPTTSRSHYMFPPDQSANIFCAHVKLMSQCDNITEWASLACAPFSFLQSVPLTSFLAML